MNKAKPYIFLIFFLLISPLTNFSQENPTPILQLVMHDAQLTNPYMRGIIEEFEENQPNIQVQLVADSRTLDRDLVGLDYQDWQSYLSQGDVVFLDSAWLGTEIPYAGYLLNLEPLYSTDNLIGFDPLVENSFVWDTGRWAMPTNINPLTLSYQLAPFDELGLAYPEAGWTLDDLEIWANHFADSGESAPILVDREAATSFLRYLLGANLYDERTSPIEPNFQSAEVLDTITRLNALQINGLIEFKTIFGGDNSPIMIAPFVRVFGETEMNHLAFGFTAQGFAISKGTDHPESAYQLIRFLVEHPNFNSIVGGIPAYTEIPEDSFQTYLLDILPDDISNFINPQQSLFADYLLPIMNHEEETEISVALEEAEQEARDALANAESHREDIILVNEPAPTAEPSEGIILRFAVEANISPMPNEGVWRTVSREFVAENPEIGAVEVEVMFGASQSMTLMTDNYDCFYSPYNRVPEADLTRILPITPLLDVDASLEREDFIGGTLGQVTLDGQVWAFPMTIEPLAMWLEQGFLEENNLQIDGILSYEDFLAIVQSAPQDSPAIIPYAGTGEHFLSLVYLLGGLPIDYRVSPPIINFTSPETVEAVRSAIALIDNDRLAYVPFLDRNREGSGAAPIITAPINDAYSRSGSLIFITNNFGARFGTYYPYPFPHGEEYTPISYNLGVAFISADTAYPNECYRFISYASQEMNLFTSMPARRSTIENSSSIRPQQTIDFYRNFAELAESPDIIVIPLTSYSWNQDSLRQNILYRAVDLVIAGELSLEDALSQAQAVAEEFEVCMQDYTSPEDYNIRLYRDCYPSAWILGQ